MIVVFRGEHAARERIQAVGRPHPQNEDVVLVLRTAFGRFPFGAPADPEARRICFGKLTTLAVDPDPSQHLP